MRVADHWRLSLFEYDQKFNGYYCGVREDFLWKAFYLYFDGVPSTWQQAAIIAAPASGYQGDRNDFIPLIRTQTQDEVNAMTRGLKAAYKAVERPK